LADSLFRRLAETMEQPALATDPRFAKALARNQNAEALDEIISAWTLQHPLATLEKKLTEAAVPATRIYTIADIFADPHYAARKSIVAAPDEAMGSVAMAGVVPRLSATPGGVRHAGRTIGQDTSAVLGEVLGYDDAKIADLTRAGVIACAGAPASQP
jgi:crotonobetainyl-CoA:carnitine CoA-transferase CaiB-like acyl-CoA transferase